MSRRRPPDLGTLVPALKAGFVLLVAASATLMALFGDASAGYVAAAGVGGFVVGLVVVWIAFPAVPASRRSPREDDWR